MHCLCQCMCSYGVKSCVRVSGWRRALAFHHRFVLYIHTEYEFIPMFFTILYLTCAGNLTLYHPTKIEPCYQWWISWRDFLHLTVCMSWPPRPPPPLPSHTHTQLFRNVLLWQFNLPSLVFIPDWGIPVVWTRRGLGNEWEEGCCCCCSWLLASRHSLQLDMLKYYERSILVVVL